jgi:hypothetical protein
MSPSDGQCELSQRLSLYPATLLVSNYCPNFECCLCYVCVSPCLDAVASAASLVPIMRVNCSIDEVKHRGKYNNTVKKLQARAQHQQILLEHTQEQIHNQQELHAVGALAARQLIPSIPTGDTSIPTRWLVLCCCSCRCLLMASASRRRCMS